MPGRREQAPRFARRNCKLCAHSASIVAALGRQCAAAARTAGIQTQSPMAKQRRLPLEATHPTGVGQQTRPVPMRRRDYGPRNRGTQPHYPHDNSTNIPQCRGPARPFALNRGWRTNVRPRGTARFRRMCLSRAEFMRGDATVVYSEESGRWAASNSRLRRYTTRAVRGSDYQHE